MPHSKSYEKCNNNKGFTMIELMVVIAILCILGLLSIGPMMRWRANSFVETAANNIMSDFERAKVEAIRKTRNVSVAFTNSGTYECFIDTNRNLIRDAGETLLFSREPELGVVDMVFTSIGGGTTFTNPRGITFSPRGFVISNTNSLQITIDGTNSRSNLRRVIEVSRTGNISSTAAKTD